MALTYTWKITEMKTRDEDGFDDVVVQTYWTKTGIDEHGNSAIFAGATPFNLDLKEGQEFTPFNMLTEEIVLSWIKSVVVGHYEEHVNSQIQRQIDLKKQKTVPLPWAPSVQPTSKDQEVTNVMITLDNPDSVKHP